MAYEQFAHHYDRLMSDMPYPQWIYFVQSCWAKYSAEAPQSVVDLGCGTGNIAIPLAGTGLRMIGIDLSDDMLAVSRDKAERVLGASAPTPVWLQQDMREWEYPEQVDSVISMCDCLNYLTEEDDIVGAFRQVHAGLKQGGLFIFDVHTPYQIRLYAQEQPFVLNEEDIAYIWYCDLDEQRCEVTHELTIFAQSGNGSAYQRIDELHRQRAYPLDWIAATLEEQGFSVIGRFADFGWDAPDTASERAFFVARKL